VIPVLAISVLMELLPSWMTTDAARFVRAWDCTGKFLKQPVTLAQRVHLPHWRKKKRNIQKAIYIEGHNVFDG